MTERTKHNKHAAKPVTPTTTVASGTQLNRKTFNNMFNVSLMEFLFHNDGKDCTH